MLPPPPWRGGLELGVAPHGSKEIMYMGNISFKWQSVTLLSELAFHLPFPFNFIGCILHWCFFLVGNVFAPIEYSHNHKPSLMVTKCYLFIYVYLFFIGFYSICFLWHVSFPATETGISGTWAETALGLHLKLPLIFFGGSLGMQGWQGR